MGSVPCLRIVHNMHDMEHIPIPPPPPITSAESPSSPSILSARRQAQQQRLSPLATHFTAAQLSPSHTLGSAYPVSTPLTAASSSHVGFLPSVNSSSRRPTGLMTSYNPQEWGSSGTVGGAYVPHSATAERTRARGTRDVSGMEGTIQSLILQYIGHTIR